MSAPSRTVLAWNRTALTAFGLGALLIKVGLDRQLWFEVLAGTAVLAAAIVLTVGDRGGRRSLASGAVAAIAGLVAVAAALTVLALLP